MFFNIAYCIFMVGMGCKKYACIKTEWFTNIAYSGSDSTLEKYGL